MSEIALLWLAFWVSYLIVFIAIYMAIKAETAPVERKRSL